MHLHIVSDLTWCFEQVMCRAIQKHLRIPGHFKQIIDPWFLVMVVYKTIVLVTSH